MAKVEFGFTAQDLFKTISQIDPSKLQEAAELIVKDIRLQAQGKKLGITRDGKTQRLPELSEGYQSQRSRYYKPRGRLSDKTGARQKRSNLTLSGDLMNGLTYRVNANRGEIEIFFGGEHTTAKIERDLLYTYLLRRDKNYEVLNLRDRLFVQITNLITREIAKQLRNFQ